MKKFLDTVMAIAASILVLGIVMIILSSFFSKDGYLVIAGMLSLVGGMGIMILTWIISTFYDLIPKKETGESGDILDEDFTNNDL